MRKTLLTAAATLACAATVQAGVEFKVGYSSIVGEYRFNHAAIVAVAPFVVNTTKTEDISVGVITFGGAVMAPVTDMISVGFSAGASMTGEWEFDESSDFTPLAPGVNADEGDTTTYQISKLPIMARIAATIAAGPGKASLGIGLGAVILGWTQEMNDQRWWDGTTQGSASGNKNNPTDVKYGNDVSYGVGAVPVFTVEVAPAYHYKLNEKSSIGLEIPLQFVGETILGGSHRDYTATAPTGAQNPTYNGELEIGGMEWGVNLVYTVKI